MKRRELIAGAVSVAGLAVANKVLADPLTPNDTVVKPEFLAATVVELYQVPLKVGGADAGATPVVILKARDQERFLPIYVGLSESVSITLALDGVQPKRPLSHDLMAALVGALQGQVEGVYIGLMGDKIYRATLKVSGQGGKSDVDSRPSDALALALRLQAPIFVAADLMQPTTLEALKAELKPV